MDDHDTAPPLVDSTSADKFICLALSLAESSLTTWPADPQFILIQTKLTAMQMEDPADRVALLDRVHGFFSAPVEQPGQRRVCRYSATIERLEGRPMCNYDAIFHCDFGTVQGDADQAAFFQGFHAKYAGDEIDDESKRTIGRVFRRLGEYAKRQAGSDLRTPTVAELQEEQRRVRGSGSGSGSGSGGSGSLALPSAIEGALAELNAAIRRIDSDCPALDEDLLNQIVSATDAAVSSVSSDDETAQAVSSGDETAGAGDEGETKAAEDPFVLANTVRARDYATLHRFFSSKTDVHLPDPGRFRRADEADQRVVWQCLDHVTTFYGIYQTVPSALIELVTDEASTLVEQFREGNIDLSSVDIAALGQAVMEKVSADDLQALEATTDDITAQLMSAMTTGAMGSDMMGAITGLLSQR